MVRAECVGGVDGMKRERERERDEEGRRGVYVGERRKACCTQARYDAAAGKRKT